MNAAPFPSLTPHELVQLLLKKRMLWLVPAIAGGLLAAAYSLVTPRYWEASQGLVVRQETAGSRGQTPGKFADLYEMRTLQETILEVAKSQEVIVGTLKAVDQRMGRTAGEPTALEVEELRERLKMLPPHGGEFGKTEVFYFYVKDTNRTRAIELVGELCRQLDIALKALRTERAQSLVTELQEQVNLAMAANAEQTDRLSAFEKEVGPDLSELRMLHSASSGQSDLRTEVVQLEADARKFSTQVREADELLKLLTAAAQDPQKLVATPNSLLTTQPAVRQLKDGLIKAQITTARLQGTRSLEHPQVQAAIEAEKQIQDDLHGELLTAIRGAEVERDLAQQRLTANGDRLKEIQGRLARLAEQRAEYSNRVAAVDNSRASLDQARRNLSVARAAEAAAQGASLVTRIGEPETGAHPVGPGRTIITLAGAVGGLMFGLGLVFLTAGGPVAEQDRGFVGVRMADSPRGEAAIAGRARNAAARPAPVEPVRPMRTAPEYELAEAVAHRKESEAVPTAPAATTWDVEARPSAEHWSEESTSAGLAAASKSLLGGGGANSATATAVPPARKPSLPIPPGSLPTAGGSLPSLATMPAGPVSLQEAMQGVRPSSN